MSVWIHVELRFPFFFFIHVQQLLGDSVLFVHCSSEKKLKIGPTVLFTHLKIILLQCFQFSVFNFSKNKLHPNGP